jgi:hypothetical protein
MTGIHLAKTMSLIPATKHVPTSLLTWLALACIVAVHLVSGKLRFLDVIPRSRWLSIAGGVSVAYAFLHLLPELSEHQKVLRQASIPALGFISHHAYLVAAIGLAFFYGIERGAVISRRRRRESTQEDATTPATFWITAGAFAVYNLLIGYLLQKRFAPDSADLLPFALAMALHFLVVDYGLHQHHRKLYSRYGRWLLAIAITFGALTASAIHIPEVALSMIVAFLAGGIILNVLKEELPAERESRFSAFATGLAAYAALLLYLG